MVNLLRLRLGLLDEVSPLVWGWTGVPAYWLEICLTRRQLVAPPNQKASVGQEPPYGYAAKW